MKKCPRCELNYIADDEKLCKICTREIKGSHKQDEIELCSICNAAPALPGNDVCLGCYKEIHGQQTADHSRSASVDEGIELNSASTMDEIIPNVDDDEELSLETIIEEEDEQDEEADEF